MLRRDDLPADPAVVRKLGELVVHGRVRADDAEAIEDKTRLAEEAEHAVGWCVDHKVDCAEVGEVAGGVAAWDVQLLGLGVAHVWALLQRLLVAEGWVEAVAVLADVLLTGSVRRAQLDTPVDVLAGDLEVEALTLKGEL